MNKFMKSLIRSENLFALVISFGIFSSFVSAQITVEVSPTFSSIAYSNSIKLSPDDKEVFDLDSTPDKDTYKLVYSIKNTPLEILVIDRRDVINSNPNPNFLMDKFLTGSSFLSLPQMPSKEGVGVVLLNDSQTSADLSYIVFRTGIRSKTVVNQLKNVIEVPIQVLDKFYKLPKIKVAVLPCGTVNAFSSPDITICSELISDLYEKGLSEALYPILLHEIAHSLLNLWNLPGYDNEDIADEFSAAMLARVAPSHIQAFIKYLENEDSTTEAIIQLTEGSRHTISIQRARNMKTALTKIGQIEKRWDNLLKPYKRTINTK